MKVMKNGTEAILTVNEISEEHKIIYNNEEEGCYFNLKEDISHNDMIIIN